MKFSISTFIIQIINFTLLAYILYRVLYRPLRNIMDKRRRLVMEDVDRAVRMKEEALALKDKYEGIMAGIEKFRKDEMERAIKTAEESKMDIIDSARRQAAEEKEKAEAVIDADRTEMLEKVRLEAADISSGLAARLIEPLADESLHKKLVRLMSEELERHPPAGMRGPGRTGRVRLSSAYPLGPGERSELESLLREQFGQATEIEHTVEPGLIAGVRLWIDGQVLDGSLKGQLSYFRERTLKSMEEHA